MALFYVGGRFPGPGVKISKSRPRIRISGPKLPIWGSFCIHQAIFKKWQFSTWVVAPTLSSLWFFIRLNQFDMDQIAKTRGYNSTSRYIYISQYCDREGHLKLKNGQKLRFFSIFWKKYYLFAYNFSQKQIFLRIETSPYPVFIGLQYEPTFTTTTCVP